MSLLDHWTISEQEVSDGEVMFTVYSILVEEGRRGESVCRVRLAQKEGQQNDNRTRREDLKLAVVKKKISAQLIFRALYHLC